MERKMKAMWRKALLAFVALVASVALVAPASAMPATEKLGCKYGGTTYKHRAILTSHSSWDGYGYSCDNGSWIRFTM